MQGLGGGGADLQLKGVLLLVSHTPRPAKRDLLVLEYNVMGALCAYGDMHAWAVSSFTGL